MKSVTLIKHHSSVQLAHLYEHLFAMQAKRLFLEKGLYKGLDYWISGKTFDQGGIVKVECDLYSAAAMRLEKSIREISLQIDNPPLIARALSQIVAEEAEILYI